MAGLSTGDHFAEEAEKIGFPLLIKAAAGGGGKGMQIVRDRAGLQAAVQMAKTAALRAFGDDAVYAERYEEKPRHIEVQVLADAFSAMWFTWVSGSAPFNDDFKRLSKKVPHHGWNPICVNASAPRPSKLLTGQVITMRVPLNFFWRRMEISSFWK